MAKSGPVHLQSGRVHLNNATETGGLRISLTEYERLAAIFWPKRFVKFASIPDSFDKDLRDLDRMTRWTRLPIDWVCNMAFMIRSIELDPIPAAMAYSCEYPMYVLGTQRWSETYFGKKVLTRIPPAQNLLGRSVVSVSATPMGFGRKFILLS